MAKIKRNPAALKIADLIFENYDLKNANDAKKEWLLAAMEEGIDIPEPSYWNMSMNQGLNGLDF